jgi:hypothetical protein
MENGLGTWPIGAGVDSPGFGCGGAGACLGTGGGVKVADGGSTGAGSDSGGFLRLPPRFVADTSAPLRRYSHLLLLSRTLLPPTTEAIIFFALISL